MKTIIRRCYEKNANKIKIKKKWLDILLMIDKLILMNTMKNRLKLNIVMPFLREQFWKYIFRGNNFHVFLREQFSNCFVWKSIFEREIFKLFFEEQFWKKYLSCLLVGMGADLYDCWLGWPLIGMTYDWDRCCLRWVLIEMTADQYGSFFILSIIIH